MCCVVKPIRAQRICYRATRRHRDLDSGLRLVAALRHAARERGGPLPSIDVADALLDERCELTGLPRLTSSGQAQHEPLIEH